MEQSKAEVFKELTWTDIQKWAGTTVVSRGRDYQRNRRVKDLARTPRGGVVAWVQGTQQYATLVDIGEDGLTSACTCPYGGTCKHAVAVVVEYLEQLKQNVQVPAVTDQDQRLALLQETSEGAWNESGEGDVDHLAPRQTGKAAISELRPYLEQQTKEQLIVLLEELARHHPIVREALQDRRDLSSGAVRRLINAVNREIDTLSTEPGWRDSWRDDGYIPDYSRVRESLEALLSMGHANDVVALGGKLLKAGTQQVEMSHDEGETAEEIASCLNVVFQALSQCSLSPAEQMLWAVEAELSDEYELCLGAEAFWQQEHRVADWNTLAGELMQRLNRQQTLGSEDSSSTRYHRDRLSDWLILALERAGREEEVIPLCEREAVETGSYVRLVRYLIEANRREEATHWIYEGVRATQKQWPGIASQLRTMLRGLREEENDWPAVVALQVEDFFRRPGLETLKGMQKAAERAGVWPTVRAAAMHYLETGEFPQGIEQSVKGETMLPWPLPKTGLQATIEAGQRQFPLTKALIDIAIAEKRPDDVLR